MCDRKKYSPLDFALSRHAFELIESAFSLSPLTVPSLESDPGTYSRFLEYTGDDTSKLRRIRKSLIFVRCQYAAADSPDTILKAPQKREIFNWGLSLSYDVETSMTTAFLYGTGLHHLSSDGCRPQNQNRGRCPIVALVQSIKAGFLAWDHPMLLPCLFLSEHLNRIIFFTTHGKVLTETVDIEAQLGVTKVGHSVYRENAGRGPDAWQPNDPPNGLGKTNPIASHRNNVGIPLRNRIVPKSAPTLTLTREETEDLIVRINTQSTRIVFTARSPDWNLAGARFILKLLDEIAPRLVPSHRHSQHECRQLLEHNITLAEAAASNIAVIRERMALQLAVLYNFVAQLDNQTSAELAASASRDSTSMKILAFISALFLPGSFIATMFSMDMFDWKQKRSEAVVSNRFWVYWAAALPLTAVTVLGWAAWWYFELGRFDRKIRNIRRRPTAQSVVPQGP